MMNCLDCGYCIDKLPQNRCPECERTFDLEDPATFAVDNPRGRPFRSGIGYLLCSLLGTGAMAYPLLQISSGRSGLGLRYFVLGLAVQIGLLFFGFASISFDRFRYGTSFRASMWVGGITVVLGTAFLLWASMFH